jgi:hypothetical protein
MSELLISYYEHPALSNAGGKSMAAPPQLKVSIGGGLWRLKGLPDGLRDVTLRIQAQKQ